MEQYKLSPNVMGSGGALLAFPAWSLRAGAASLSSDWRWNERIGGNWIVKTWAVFSVYDTPVSGRKGLVIE